MDTKALGTRGEDAAAAYLERVGMTVVQRNWRCRFGEIDIVAVDGETLVLCEVKTRKSTRAGQPEEAVNATKQRKLAKLASAYLADAGLSPQRVRFDVVSIRVLSDDRALLRHVRDAFSLDA